MTYSLLHEQVFDAVTSSGERIEVNLVEALTDPRVRSLGESPDVSVGTIRISVVFIACAMIHAGILTVDDVDDEEELERLFKRTIPFIKTDAICEAIKAYATQEHIQPWFDIDDPNGLGQVEGVVPSDKKVIDGTNDGRYTLFPMLSMPLASPLPMTKRETAKRLIALPIVAVGGNHPKPHIEGVPRPPSKLFKASGAPRKDWYPYGYGVALNSPLTYVEGDTFLQTVLNAMTPEIVRDAFITPPVWELPKPTETPWGDSSGVRMNGPVAVMTYPVRHVYASFEGDHLSNAQVYPGDGRTVKMLNDFDPMTSLKPIVKGEQHDMDDYGSLKYSSRMFYGETPFRSWNSARCVIPSVEGDKTASKAVQHALALNKIRGGGSAIAIVTMNAVFAQDPFRSKVHGVYEDRVEIPAFLLDVPPKGSPSYAAFLTYAKEINDEIAAVTSVAGKLASVIKGIESNGAENCPAFRSEEYRNTFLYRMEQPFRKWLIGLPAVDWNAVTSEETVIDELKAYCETWHIELRKHAVHLLDEYTASLSAKAWYARKVSSHYAFLYKFLNTTVPVQKPITEEAK